MQCLREMEIVKKTGEIEIPANNIWVDSGTNRCSGNVDLMPGSLNNHTFRGWKIILFLSCRCLDTGCLFYARSITASLPICPPRGEHNVLNQTAYLCSNVYDKRTYTDSVKVIDNYLFHYIFQWKYTDFCNKTNISGITIT